MKVCFQSMEENVFDILDKNFLGMILKHQIYFKKELIDWTSIKILKYLQKTLLRE
jgi:hypothetical protein